jgi:type II secretory pathway pseudopilin PulG
MLNKLSNFQKGDTIIEVLFAITIFSLVAVGSMSIMNQGTQTAQRSLEITLVRSEIDAQAEALRFIHESYIAAPSTTSQWWAITGSTNNKIVDKASDFGTCDSGSGVPAKPFVINTKSGTLSDVTPKMLPSIKSVYSQLNYDYDPVAVDGIWVEAVQSSSEGGKIVDNKYIDFHIRACWYGPGQSTPMTLGTIVRLYDPAS